MCLQPYTIVAYVVRVNMTFHIDYALCKLD